MNNGRNTRAGRHGRRRLFGSKSVALVLACVLLVAGVIGGTVAWLTAQDTPVTNTFTPSTIGVELKEHTYNATTDALTTETTDTGVSNYKMIPGWTIPKDPEAWITTNSEAAYLFVKVEKSTNFDTFMSYEIASGWTELTSAAGTNYKVYYREVAAGATAAAMDETNAFQILANDKITVLSTVTTQMMNALTADNYPTLTFTAYAHQLYSASGTKFDAATAWNNLNPSTAS